MKILFCIHSLTSGGAERVLSLLANSWQQHHHKITIAVDKVDLTFYDIDKSIEILDIGVLHKGFAKKITGNFKRIQVIRQAIDDVDPDIVLGFMTTMNINVTIAAKLAGKPVVISERNNFHFIKSPVWKFLRRIIYPFSSALIVQTSYDLKNYNYHSNISIIENPLLLNHKHKDIQRKKIILAIGRLHVDKGFDLLIDAFNLLKDKKDWKLTILGEGKERKNLEEQIKRLNLSDHISLPGTFPDVELHYKKASIFVLSSRGEGFPNVLCEAMGYGCPSISFDCLTGPRDIIKNGYNGLLVEAENVEMLSDSIQDLINNQKKGELLSGNALEICKRLDIEKISIRWHDIIDDTLKKKTP